MAWFTLPFSGASAIQGEARFMVKGVIFGVPLGMLFPKKCPRELRIDGAGDVLTNSITSSLSPTDPFQMQIT